MTPLEFLAVLLVMTAAAAAVHAMRRRRRVDALRRLAAEAGMHFSALDRFRLAPRVAQLLPVPGAAAIRVLDLIYGVEERRYRYVFATEYTTGVLRSKTGVRRVAAWSEPRDPGGGSAAPGGPAAPATPAGKEGELIFAPQELPVLEQYKHLLQAIKS